MWLDDNCVLLLWRGLTSIIRLKETGVGREWDSNALSSLWLYSLASHTPHLFSSAIIKYTLVKGCAHYSWGSSKKKNSQVGLAAPRCISAQNSKVSTSLRWLKERNNKMKWDVKEHWKQYIASAGKEDSHITTQGGSHTKITHEVTEMCWQVHVHRKKSTGVRFAWRIHLLLCTCLIYSTTSLAHKQHLLMLDSPTEIFKSGKEEDSIQTGGNSNFSFFTD